MAAAAAALLTLLIVSSTTHGTNQVIAQWSQSVSQGGGLSLNGKSTVQTHQQPSHSPRVIQSTTRSFCFYRGKVPPSPSSSSSTVHSTLLILYTVFCRPTTRADDQWLAGCLSDHFMEADVADDKGTRVYGEYTMERTPIGTFHTALRDICYHTAQMDGGFLNERVISAQPMVGRSGPRKWSLQCIKCKNSLIVQLIVIIFLLRTLRSRRIN